MLASSSFLVKSRAPRCTELACCPALMSERQQALQLLKLVLGSWEQKGASKVRSDVYFEAQKEQTSLVPRLCAADRQTPATTISQV